MRLTQLTRRSPPWLRIAVAGLVMAFVLSSIAHLTHRHEAVAGSTAHVVACGYCLGFGALATTSVPSALTLAAVASDELTIATAAVLLSFKSPCAAQPRAPPLS
jgi:hypothetical protein